MINIVFKSSNKVERDFYTYCCDKNIYILSYPKDIQTFFQTTSHFWWAKQVKSCFYCPKDRFQEPLFEILITVLAGRYHALVYTAQKVKIGLS